MFPPEGSFDYGYHPAAMLPFLTRAPYRLAARLSCRPHHITSFKEPQDGNGSFNGGNEKRKDRGPKFPQRWSLIFGDRLWRSTFG